MKQADDWNIKYTHSGVWNIIKDMVEDFNKKFFNLNRINFKIRNKY